MATKTTVHDIDMVAGDFFDGGRLTKVDWFDRAKAFAYAMKSCDRAVILTVDESGDLRLSSIPAGVNQLIEARKSK